MNRFKVPPLRFMARKKGCFSRVELNSGAGYFVDREGV